MAVLPGDLLADLSSAVHFPLLNSVFLMLFWFYSYFSKYLFTQHRHSPSSSMLECLGEECLSPLPLLYVLTYLIVVG